MKCGAIFDMDGLLFDTEMVYDTIWKKVAERRGLTVQEQMLAELRGVGREEMTKIILRYWPQADPAAIRTELFEGASEELRKKVPVKSGVTELLEYLREKGVKMAVASGSPLESIKNNLKVAKIDSYFEVVVSGEQVSYGKPAPDIFLLAAKELRLEPAACYVFEDAPSGVYAAVNAGCTTVMVPDRVPPTEELYQMAAGIYKSLDEVLHAMKTGELSA